MDTTYIIIGFIKIFTHNKCRPSYYNVLYMLVEPANSSISASDLWCNRRQCWDEALIRCNNLEKHLLVEERTVVMKENGCVGH